MILVVPASPTRKFALLTPGVVAPHHSPTPAFLGCGVQPSSEKAQPGISACTDLVALHSAQGSGGDLDAIQRDRLRLSQAFSELALREALCLP